MNGKQISLYWREWAKVRRTYPDADRHELHIQALGYDKSHQDFDNRDFDQVLGVFRAISQPANLNAQLDAMGQERKRLNYAIHQRAPQEYIEALMRDRWGHTDLDRLSITELTQLRNTLTTRSRKLRRREREAATSTP